MQYVLFFIIGISLFVSLGNTFLFQYRVFNKGLAESNIVLANSFLSSQAIYLWGQCRQCQQVSQNIAAQNLTFSNLTYQSPVRFLFSNLSNTGLVVKDPMTDQNYSSNMHNMNYTLNFTSGFATFSRTIGISIDKTINTTKPNSTLEVRVV